MEMQLLKKICKARVERQIFSLLLFLLTPLLIFPSRSNNRYFPFLERPGEYVTAKKSFFYPSIFITNASTAFKAIGGNTGIPELWGTYDLKEVIQGLEVVKAASGIANYNPFINEIGYDDWNSKELRFRVDGKIKSRGLALALNQNFFKSNFSCGCFLPIMKVNTSLRFTFNPEISHADTKEITQPELEMLDRVRRSVHSDLCLQGADWSKTGFGDLDLFFKWRSAWDHKLKMKTIDTNIRAGILVPTGSLSHKDYPSSVSFMGDGHWGIYLDSATEFELKQNWKLGLIAGFVYQFANTRDRRISYCAEPPMFSALSGNIEIDPGNTIKISPYFTLENLMDGLNFQIRYTYLRHSPDVWTDKRDDKAVESYLELDIPNIERTRSARRWLSRWEIDYVTLQVVYDSVEGMKHWTWEPKIYAILDYAFSGKGAAKTHQFTLGVELNLW